MNIFTSIKNNMERLSLTFGLFVLFILSTTLFFKSVTYIPTLSYTISDKVMFSDGDCQFRSRWSSGYARTDNGDYFSCKEENTMIGYTATHMFNSKYTFEEYGGIVPWYGDNGVCVLSFLGMVGFFSTFIFWLFETKKNWF